MGQSYQISFIHLKRKRNRLSRCPVLPKMATSTNGGNMKIEHTTGTKFWRVLIEILGQMGRWR
jgi:hypothetical protein